MIIELIGGQFVNQGAALMLQVVVDRVRAAIPGTAFAMALGPWASAADRHRMGFLVKFPLRKRRLDLNGFSYGWPKGLDSLILRRGVAFEGVVDAALDLSGYAYGDRWGPLSLETTRSRLRRASRHRRPYIFLPQAFGPFSRVEQAARDFGNALTGSPYIAARDSESVAALANVCPPGISIKHVPDITIGYPGANEVAVGVGVDRRTALIIPNVRMLDPGSAVLGWGLGYLPLLRQLAEEARVHGFVPRVLNHSGREDRMLAERLNLPRIIEESDPVRTKGVIGAAGLVISSRYHGCVSALSQGVPCLATSWSHKYQALFEDFQQPDAVITMPDADAAVTRLKDLIARRVEISDALHRSAREQTVRVDAMWREIIAILKSAETR